MCTDKNSCPDVERGTIARLLGRGSGAALTRRELEALTGVDGRTVRRVIEQERRSGMAILSDNRAGYYLPADEREREAFVSSMRRRAGEILKTAAAVEAVGKGG